MFFEDNEVDLGELVNNLVTTGRWSSSTSTVSNIPVYPYVVQGGFTVVSKSRDSGLYDAHFGMVLTQSCTCERGYESTGHPRPAGRQQQTDERAGPLRRAADREHRPRSLVNAPAPVRLPCTGRRRTTRTAGASAGVTR